MKSITTSKVYNITASLQVTMRENDVLLHRSLNLQLVVDIYNLYAYMCFRLTVTFFLQYSQATGYLTLVISRAIFLVGRIHEVLNILHLSFSFNVNLTASLKR